MLRDKETSKQKEYEIVLLDELVPQDHILRKIDAAVDFSFIHNLCKDLYSPNIGRMLWIASCTLRRRLKAREFMHGVKRQLNDLLRRLKKTMACVLLACSASRTCASNAS